MNCIIEKNYEPKETDKVFTLMGGDPKCPSWDEYLEGIKEEYQPHFITIKECIIKSGYLGMTAECASNDVSFVFDDGCVFNFSWRAWGDLMQAIVDKREGYMQYYM